MIEVVQAYDRAPLKNLATDTADQLHQKLSLAHRLFRDRASWLKPHQRLAILHRLAELMAARRDSLAMLISREGGKPLRDARVEADRAIDGIRNSADLLRTRGGTEIPMGLTSASDGRRAWTIQEPIGVVAAISAFNHPLNLCVHQLGPAIATGCPIIIKSAATTPLSCLELVGLIHEAGMPEGWVQTFLPQDNGLAEAFATDARIAFLSFIGSAKVGWHLRSKLAPGARCALEHGGAAPVIVDCDVDLDRVIEPLVKGGYYHAGQVCVSVQRIIAHEDIKDALVERLAARVETLRVGDPTNAETDVGPLILPRETDRVTGWIEEALAAGARLVHGGRHSATTLNPCVLVDPPRDAKVSTLEIFGPVTCVYGYRHLHDAVAQANELPLAFQSSVFTRNLDVAFEAAENLDGGAVMINDHTAFRTDWMPFAGHRQSGYGVGGIPFTAREMTSEKMLVFKR